MDTLVYILLISERGFARVKFHARMTENEKYYFLTGYCRAMGKEWMFDVVPESGVFHLPEIDFFI